MSLDLDEDKLAACVSCGLCLPHCPTYRVTGEESASPRGRIAAMREARVAAEVPAQFAEFMDLCVGCRGCETACPSSVRFGELMDAARAGLARDRRYVPAWRRAGYALLAHHRALLAASSVAALLQRARLLPDRLGLPPLPLHRGRLRPGAGAAAPGGRRDLDNDRDNDRGNRAVWLFTGCVMDAWMRQVHRAAASLIEQAGGVVRLAGPRAACCGALHLHAGLGGRAQSLARRVVSAMPGDTPVLVDSAGCAAALSEYGTLLGTEEAERFSSRVIDVNQWLAQRLDLLPAARGARVRVAVQDPCHLRHALGAHQHVRTLLSPYATVIELDDSGLCCGAGGSYAMVHREMAERIRSLKLDAISRTGARLVASANPGCIAHLRRAGLDVRHPVEIVAAATSGSAEAPQGFPA
jgi:glycolate oxidase iron-sulfur subunit